MIDSFSETDLAAWANLMEVDRLTVIPIVDNETDGLSSPCLACDPTKPGWSGASSYQSEFSSLTKAFLEGRLEALDMRRTLRAGHGLSLLIVAEIEGGICRTLILDGGPDPDLWRGNADGLGLEGSDADAAVLSHWHPDHSVGLAAVSQWASRSRISGSSNQANKSPFHIDLHPDRPLRRGFETQDKSCIPFNEDVKLDALKLPGCIVQLHRDAHLVCDGIFFISGAIPRLTDFEIGLPNQVALVPDGVHLSPEDEIVGSSSGIGTIPRGTWIKDPMIHDERYVAVRVRGRGIVVFSSCSHAGIVNVALHASNLSIACGWPKNLFGIVGGFHLSGRELEPRIAKTITELRHLLDPEIGVILGGHCTGWRAKAAFAEGLSMGRFQPSSVGGKYVFG